MINDAWEENVRLKILAKKFFSSYSWENFVWEYICFAILYVSNTYISTYCKTNKTKLRKSLVQEAGNIEFQCRFEDSLKRGI